MQTSPQLLLAFYGDDFTGSTDALEFLCKAGIKTMLFIEPPTLEQLKKYPGLQAIGVAGMTRSMSPAEMEKALLPAFTSLKKLAVPHVHYKVCSTFDSSPTVGSIGKAIDVGAHVFKSQWIPLLVAAPALGRYCAFGNLFARMGIGSKGEIYRLDRHPSMSKHPVTPADEGDLRLHLAKQTTKKIGLMNVLDIELPRAEMQQKLEALVDDENKVILFDALYEEQLEPIGALLARAAGNTQTLFSVGSSGIEMALGMFWKKQGLLNNAQQWVPSQHAGPILVISGSCSPVTSRQINWALQNGFAEVALDTEALATSADIQKTVKKDIEKALAILNQGTSVIVHTSRGGDDPRLEKTKQQFNQNKQGGTTQAPAVLGTALGMVARELAARSSLKRILIAGGDTSGFAARAMGIEAVEVLSLLAPGAPLCRAIAPGSPVDGLEVNFKGGQVGDERYFGSVLAGQILE